MEKNEEKITVPFSLGKYIKLCLKYWYVFLISIAAFVFLALGYLKVKKTMYEVDAQLMLPTETSSGGILALADMANFSLGDMFGSSSTENEIAVMKSQTVFENTVRELGMQATYLERVGFMKWMPAREQRMLDLTTLPSIPDTLRGSIKFDITPQGNGKFDIKAKWQKRTIVNEKGVSLPVTLETVAGPFTITPTTYFTLDGEVDKFRILYMSYSTAAQVLNTNVNIYAPNKKTDFVALSYVTPIPKFGKLLLSTIIDNYNMMGNDQKNDKNNRTIQFVDERLKDLTLQLNQAETNMEQFKLQNKLTDVEVDAATALQRSSVIESSLLWTEMENEMLRMTKSFISNPENKYAFIPTLVVSGTDASSSTAPAAAEINAYNELLLNRMKLVSSAKENSSSVQALDKQLESIHKNIEVSVDQAYRTSQLKLRDLKKEDSNNKSRLGSIPTLEKEYINLFRDQKLQETLYLFLLKQREEAAMNLARVMPSMVTVDEPYTLYKPVGLSTPIVLCLAIFLGGLIPLLWVFYFKMKSAPYADYKILQTISKTPVLCRIFKNRQDEYAPADVRLLRTNIQYALENKLNQCIMVSVPSGNYNIQLAKDLAQAFALAQYSTLYIDALLDNHSSELGLGNIIQGTTKPEDCIKVEKLSDGCALDVLPSGNSPMLAADLLAAPGCAEIIREFIKVYDYVIIKGAALLGESDSLALADCIDLTLVACDNQLTTPTEVQRLNDMYQMGRMPRMALVAVTNDKFD